LVLLVSALAFAFTLEMEKDDENNSWVVVAFAILAGINAFLLIFTVYKLQLIKRIRDHSRHLEVLYLSIVIYSICKGHIVRIIWYFDVAVDYPIAIYLVLEDLPMLPLFTAYSTISCLW